MLARNHPVPSTTTSMDMNLMRSQILISEIKMKSTYQQHSQSIQLLDPTVNILIKSILPPKHPLIFQYPLPIFIPFHSNIHQHICQIIHPNRRSYPKEQCPKTHSPCKNHPRSGNKHFYTAVVILFVVGQCVLNLSLSTSLVSTMPFIPT